jgi:hypothetical protein
VRTLSDAECLSPPRETTAELFSPFTSARGCDKLIHQVDAALSRRERQQRPSEFNELGARDFSLSIAKT